MCVAKGVIHMRKNEDFTNEKGLQFLVQSARNIAYILDEEAEEPITKLQKLLSYLQAQGAITEEQQKNAAQELKEALKGQIKELYKPKTEEVQERLQWLQEMELETDDKELQETKQFYQDFWESYEN